MLPVFRAKSPLLATLGIIVLLAVISYVQPGLLDSFSTLARMAVGALAAVAGVYIVYNAMQSRDKTDDFISTFFALMLFAFAAYLGFGVNLAGVLDQITTAFRTAIPFLLSAGSTLTGLVLLGKRDTLSRAIGIALMIIALVLLVMAV